MSIKKSNELDRNAYYLDVFKLHNIIIATELNKARVDPKVYDLNLK